MNPTIIDTRVYVRILHSMPTKSNGNGRRQSYESNLTKFGLAVLLVDGTAVVLPLLPGLENGTSHGLDLLLGVARIVLQGAGPDGSIGGTANNGLAGNNDRCGGKLRREVLQELVGLQSAIEQEVGQSGRLLIGAGPLEEPAEEGVGRRHGDVELEGGQDLPFHLKDVAARVGLVAHVDTVCHREAVHFFVLGSDEEAGDAHQLQAGTVHFNSAEVPIEEVDAKVECLW